MNLIANYERLSRELRRRVMMMIGRAVLKVIDDSTGLQIVQVEALAGEVIDRAERIQSYGFTSHPLPGADALVLAVGGMRQHPVVLVDDRRHRVKDLGEGEVAVYTDEDEPGNLHRIVLRRGRVVEVHGSSVRFMSSNLTHNGVNVGDDHVHPHSHMHLFGNTVPEDTDGPK